MALNEIATFGKRVGDVMVRNSPTILTVLGVGGLATSIFMAVKVTPKAIDLIALEQDARKRDGYVENMPVDPITKMDMIKLTWKLYIPAAIVGIGTAACIVGANSISMKRYAALGGLYGLAEASLKEYQAKVVETLGEKKEEAMRSDIRQDKLDKDPVTPGTTIISTGTGDVLCYDTLSGRYFTSSYETLRKIQNDFNLQVINGMTYGSLNELYDLLGLNHTKLGEVLSWSIENMLEMDFDAKIADTPEGKKPCIVIDYTVVPQRH
jgi:hypothetical protein